MRTAFEAQFESVEEFLAFSRMSVLAQQTTLWEEWRRVMGQSRKVTNEGLAKQAEAFLAFLYDTVWQRLDPEVITQLVKREEGILEKVLASCQKESESEAEENIGGGGKDAH